MYSQNNATNSVQLETLNILLSNTDFIFQENETNKNLKLITKIKKYNNYVIIKRIVKNRSNSIVKLKEMYFKAYGFDFNNKSDDYFFANENARIYGKLALNFEEKGKNPTKWVDNGVVEGRILSSPYQPFPCLLVSNYNTNLGVLFGSLSQNYFYHNYDVSHSDNGKITVKIYSSFKSVGYREILPNEKLEDIIYIGLNKNSNDINKVFEPYKNVLKKYLKVRRSNQNRHSLIWDSWNDGVYRDISQEMLIKEAKSVKRYFNNVEWFQVDDGYSSYCEKNVDLDAHGIGVIYEGKQGIDSVKFPNGLRDYTNQIKKIGLNPSIWIGAWCPVKTKIYRDRKEWFVDYNYRVDFAEPLDVSQKDVRKYMKKAISTFIKEYGFMGIKHDFWSYAFEDRHDLLKFKNKSGYEYRKWWQKTIRKIIGLNGYVETGCDICMGNPFLGEYFNNYRYGLDVGSGKLENILTTGFWSVATLCIHVGDIFIPNSDSIALFKNLNDNEFYFLINFLIITRSLVEISGRFSLIDENEPRLKVLQKATEYLNNGEDVFFAKYDYRKDGTSMPNIIYINSAFDGKSGKKTVAIFNDKSDNQIISFSSLDLSLTDKITIKEVWNNEILNGENFNIELEPFSSKIFVVD